MTYLHTKKQTKPSTSKVVVFVLFFREGENGIVCILFNNWRFILSLCSWKSLSKQNKRSICISSCLGTLQHQAGLELTESQRSACLWVPGCLHMPPYLVTSTFLNFIIILTFLDVFYLSMYVQWPHKSNEIVTRLLGGRLKASARTTTTGHVSSPILYFWSVVIDRKLKTWTKYFPILKDEFSLRQDQDLTV